MGRSRSEPPSGRRLPGIVAAAKEQGKLRDDLDTLDVPMLELMLAAGIEFTRETPGESWRRLLGIVIDGLKAGQTRRGDADRAAAGPGRAR